MGQRMMNNFWKYQDEWNEFKKRYCKSCVNKVYCLLNEDENRKAIPARKNKKIVCVNYKARYMTEANL